MSKSLTPAQVLPYLSLAKELFNFYGHFKPSSYVIVAVVLLTFVIDCLEANCKNSVT